MPAGWVAAATVAVGAYSADSAKKTAAENRDALAAGQDQSEELNRERFALAEGYMKPYVEDSRTARDQLMIEMGLAPGEANTAYMESPGYLAAMGGAEQRMASAGSLYSGARAGATQQVSSQFYNNYMGMLQNIGNPNVATNLSSLGVNQAATLGSQNLGYINAQNMSRSQGTEAQNAALADMMGGVANAYSGYQAGGGANNAVQNYYGDDYTPPGGVSQQSGLNAYGEEIYI